MTTISPAVQDTSDSPDGSGLRLRPGRWIDGWDPENTAQWESVGRPIARRNLIGSVFAEFLGFVTLGIWSIVVPKLRAAGFDLDNNQLYWLIALPGLLGAALRVLYTFMPPIFGGRNWTVVSALMLLIPLTGLTWVVQHPDTPYGVLLLVASLAGLGGGNFASSMVNISFFYPQRERGRALGINAAGGNIGSGIVVLVVPFVIATGGAGIALYRAGLIWIPLVLGAAVLAYFTMNNLSSAHADLSTFAMAAKYRHNWILSLIYLGTFGSFLGLSFTFPKLTSDLYPHIPLQIVFIGAVVGALVRPVGGMLADRFGGRWITIGAFAVMAAGSIALVATLGKVPFAVFLGLFLVLFAASGIGNGSVYRMIPAVYHVGDHDAEGRDRARRLSAGTIGIAGAVGALGSFLIPRNFAIFGLHQGLINLTIVYVLLMALTWVVYARRGSSLAAERI